MIKQKELAIYVHIPFCVKKCLYCDFLSGPATDDVKQAYTDALCREIQDFGEKNTGKYIVKSVFFGGGTPSSIDGRLILRIMECIRREFLLKEDCEISLELNPKTADEEKLKIYMDGGINRLSVGLQSVNDDELKALGRIHSFSDFMHTYESIRKVGFDNVNVDIISSLPGQTTGSFKKTLRTVTGLKTEHVSVYSLIIEENTPFMDMYEKGQLKSLPDEDTEREIYYLTNEFLERSGYSHYEISNYALKKNNRDYESVHNKTYWERGFYAGFGIGAASFLRNERSTNTKNLQEYILNPFAPKSEITILSNNDAMSEFMYLGLRMMRGIDTEKFRLEFGRNINNVFGPVLEKYEKSGHLIREGSRIFLSKEGIDVSNYIFSDFLL